MEHTFHLEIVTPERPFFNGAVTQLVFPTADGLYGVAAGHEATVTTLSAGTVQYCTGGTWQAAAVREGFLEIMPEYVIVLAEDAAHPEEIDEKRALAARQLAEQQLQQKQSVQEHYRSQAALGWAMARLNTLKRRL